MTDFVLWYILARVSNDEKIKLLNEYENEANIYDIFVKNSMYKGSRKKKIEDRLKNVTNDDVGRFKEELMAKGIKYITINHKEYPEELKNIDSPPYVLFYKGDISLLQRSKVSIVGARKSSSYGLQVCKMLVSEIVNMEYTTVSGLAMGVDAAVHKETLGNNGNTIGVLGCGIDVIYPKSNTMLFRRVEEKGLILSEYLPNTEPLAFNFPRRNRIISGLGKILIVIEAARKSGTLITANYAAEQGKDVMVVPGSIFNKNSIGCNELIKDGARPFTSMEDLYELLGITLLERGYPKDSVKSKLLKIIEDEPTHLDKIIEKLDIDKQYIFKLLFEMQKLNEIICLPGNYYAKIC